MNGKYIIFIGGYLAAGKTTFSRLLAKELGVLCVCKDYVKEVLCDRLGFADRAENRRMSEATFDVMKHIAEQSMKVGAPLILESNFRKADGEELLPLLEEYGYKPITVFFGGDLEVLFNRFTKRLKGRHPAHTSGGHVTWDGYQEHCMALSEFDIGGERIIVDTTTSTNVDYDEVVSQIKQILRLRSE